MRRAPLRDSTCPTVTDVSLDRVVQTLTALREHRTAVEQDLVDKRQVIREYAAEAKAAGVSGRQLAHHLAGELRQRGWTEDQVRQVGISPGAVEAILSGG